jgi:hypothetical protein
LIRMVTHTSLYFLCVRPPFSHIAVRALVGSTWWRRAGSP